MTRLRRCAPWQLVQSMARALVGRRAGSRRARRPSSAVAASTSSKSWQPGRGAHGLVRPSRPARVMMPPTRRWRSRRDAQAKRLRGPGRRAWPRGTAGSVTPARAGGRRRPSPWRFVVALDVGVHRVVADGVAEAGLLVPDPEPGAGGHQHDGDHARRRPASGAAGGGPGGARGARAMRRAGGLGRCRLAPPCGRSARLLLFAHGLPPSVRLFCFTFVVSSSMSLLNFLSACYATFDGPAEDVVDGSAPSVSNRSRASIRCRAVPTALPTG